MNIYSRKYNHENWFEIYTNQESSEKQAKNEQEPIGSCSKMNENLELSEYIKISNEINTLFLISEIIQMIIDFFNK